MSQIPREFGFPAYVAAFYTTPLLRLERLILHLALRRRSSDADALATGTAATFAAWTLEPAPPSQLLPCDLSGATRSWLMTTPGEDPGTTRLWFGSAVVPRDGRTSLGQPFRLLLGFHKLYSRSLLASARRRLAAGKQGPGFL